MTNKFDNIFELLVEEIKNLHPIDEIKQIAIKNNELFFENDDYLVVSPKSHKTACIYGKIPFQNTVWQIPMMVQNGIL